MPVSASDLIEEVRTSLEAGQRGPVNRLATTVTSADTSLVFSYDLESIEEGSVISIELERIRVWEVNADSKSATVVERGVEGTTAAAHTAPLLVRVNPRFDDFQVLRALNEDIADMSSPANGLFRMKASNITYVAGRTGYDLSGFTDMIEPYEVRYESLAGDRDWPVLSTAMWTTSREMDTGEFSSGNALLVYSGASPGNAMRVRYKAHFGQFTTLAQTMVTDLGMPERMRDIPVLGAQARLMALREPRRGFYESQGQPRRAEEVPVGAQTASARSLMALRDGRIQSEAALLMSQFPTRLGR